MNKNITKYIIYVMVGAILGVLMQLMPQLQDQWGQNIFTYMATDLGIWAVICILIASHAESPLHSGMQCFACMTAMVTAYYIIVPESFIVNLRWVVVAILILPIGAVTYWYKRKAWIMLILELFLGANIVLDGFTLGDMMQKGVIVHSSEGAVYMNLTPFSFGNYILIMAITVFGMVYMPLKYRKEKQKAAS